MKCFPRKQPKQTYPDFLAIRYNAQGAPIELPERPLQLPLRVEYDPNSLVPTQPPRAHLASHNSGQLTRDRPPPSASSTAAAQQPDVLFPMRAERHRFPVNNSNDPRENWSKVVMNQSQLTELFETIHATLAHVPYVICGLAALVDHGFTARRVTAVSILCPTYAKDNVRVWLASKGYDTYADSVGIPIENGTVTCRVRIKYTDEGFDKLQRVKSSMSQAWIMGLASQIDHAATGYVDHWRRLQRMKNEGKTEDLGKTEQAMQTIARDIFWCLDKAARTRHWLNPRLMPTLLGEEFWSPFTARHVDARTEMARAGIDVAAVLAKQRDEAAVRDHNAMLKEFGFGDDGVVVDQPGPFEGMRTLAHSKSVYTLKQSREGPIGRDDGVLPPVVPSLPSLSPPTPSSSRQQQPKKDKGKGKARENKFFANLLPRRSNSTRGSGAGAKGSSSSKDVGRSLTRSHSVRPQSRDPGLAPPPPRFSEDAQRPSADWI
ncbi:hypothetical protein F5Y06DRAFT_266287 [Hypoxylon sp. FL0890]|nr:hypothetical protein F5Y06DRAFT_266287 [Hypoxylon sp. FL0890]